VLSHKRVSHISISVAAKLAPRRRQSWRKGLSVTPAIGASATGKSKL